MIENIDKSKYKADFKNTEIKMVNDDFAFWTRPVKIKELWYNAILQKPQPTKKSNKIEIGDLKNIIYDDIIPILIKTKIKDTIVIKKPTES